MSGIYAIPPNNAAPRVWFPGTDDQSGKTVAPEAEARPIHYPYYAVIASDGPLEPHPVVGHTVTNLYGEDFLNIKSKFATPVIPFVRELMKTPNMMFIHRLVPATIRNVKEATGRIRLCLDLKEVSDMRPFKRDPLTGMVLTTEAAAHTAQTIGKRKSELQLDDSASPIRGHVAQWVVELADEFGVEPTPKQKGDYTRYPILELEASFFGSNGNNVGITLDAPNINDKIPANAVLAKNQMAYLYRISLKRRDGIYGAISNLRTNNGESYLDFSFKEGVVDTFAGNNDLFIGNMLLDQYRDLDTRGGKLPNYGPFGNVKVHTANIETILEKIYATEVEANTYFAKDVLDPVTGTHKPAAEGMHLLNFFSGKDLEGRHYYTYRVNDEVSKFSTSTKSANVVLNEQSPLFAMGGRDGITPEEIRDSGLRISVNGSEVVPTVTELYDYTVRQYFNKIGTNEEEYHLDSMALHPFKNVYDVGYSMDTKLSALRFLSIRSDVNVTLNPYDFTSRPVTGVDQEKLSVVSARMQKLNEAALAHSESIINNTSCMRVVIMPQAATLITGDYRKRVPASIQLQSWRSAYMGGGDGKFEEGKGYDISPNNVATIIKDVNIKYLRNAQRESLWASGAVWLEPKERGTIFCPAVQTVYPDDTSVLNSDINMQAICEMNYRAFKVWTELTGSSRYGDDEFTQVSDKLLAEAVRGIFDGRYIITPETTIIEKDKLRGWSWTANYHAEMPNMKTVMRGTVIAHRIGEYK